MAKINIKIEGVPYEVEEGLTVLKRQEYAATRYPPSALSTTANALRVPAACASLKPPAQEASSLPAFTPLRRVWR